MAGKTVIRAVDPSAPASVEILSAYLRDIVGRFYGRPATDDDVRTALRDYPSDHLTAPDGLFLVALIGADVVGCVGLDRLGADEPELTRVFVAAEARGRGIARALLAAAEDEAAARGHRSVVLDVRADLVEAQALYRACGYEPIAPLHDEPHADLFFRKAVGSDGRR